MPWSDWQTGETRTIDWVDVGRGFRNTGGTDNGDWEMYRTSDIHGPGARISATALEATTDAGPYGRVFEQVSGAFLHLPDTWKQVRRGIPDLLSTLEYGVDWAEIPDRPGEFVEYEPGDNVPVSTRGASVFFASGSRGGGPEALRDGDGAWTLGVKTGAVAPPYADTVSTGTMIPSGQWPGLGPAFATGDDTVTVGRDYQSQFPDITGATDIFLSVRMTGVPPLSGGEEYVRFNIGVPTLTYQMPRWRYWIPEPTKKPPLRLRQRDDNLFLNAGRIRNRSSRQTTNRLRSYD